MTTTVAKPGFSLARLIFALIGLALLVIGMALGANNWYFNNGAQSAMGRVVAVEYDGDAARPTFLFTDSTGQQRLAKTNISATAYNYAIGTEVPIRYNFDFADEVRVEGWLNNWSTGLVAGIVGLWLLARRRKRVPTQPVAASAETAEPWVSADDAEAKQALIGAIMQAAGKGSGKAGGKAAAKSVVAASAKSPVPQNATGRQRPSPVLTSREPTVRRMR